MNIAALSSVSTLRPAVARLSMPCSFVQWCHGIALDKDSERCYTLA